MRACVWTLRQGCAWGGVDRAQGLGCLGWRPQPRTLSSNSRSALKVNNSRSARVPGGLVERPFQPARLTRRKLQQTEAAKSAQKQAPTPGRQAHDEVLPGADVFTGLVWRSLSAADGGMEAPWGSSPAPAVHLAAPLQEAVTGRHCFVLEDGVLGLPVEMSVPHGMPGCPPGPFVLPWPALFPSRRPGSWGLTLAPASPRWACSESPRPASFGPSPKTGLGSRYIVSASRALVMGDAWTTSKAAPAPFRTRSFPGRRQHP